MAEEEFTTAMWFGAAEHEGQLGMTTLERDTEVVELPAGPMEYRLERRGAATIIVFHGGHTRAGVAMGEEVFSAAGYTVLAPSRPGYGRTPLRTGTSPGGFADATAELCRHLGIDRIAAVVGVSAGGRTAVTMAARHPGLVRRLILESSLGFLPWPERRLRLGAHFAFRAPVEKATWGAVRVLLRTHPAAGLRTMLGGLSTEPIDEVLGTLSDEDRAYLIALFSTMRSGRGFLNDLHSTPDVTSQITQPTLIIASRKDGAVPYAHARSLAAGIPHAEQIVSDSSTHLIWLSPDYPVIAGKVRDFLAAESSQRG